MHPRRAEQELVTAVAVFLCIVAVCMALIFSAWVLLLYFYVRDEWRVK